jgi:hypothetical protein
LYFRDLGSDIRAIVGDLHEDGIAQAKPIFET